MLTGFLSLISAKLFFFMALVMDIANLTAPPVVAWSLGQSIWLPFYLSGGLFVILLLIACVLPNTGIHRTVLDAKDLRSPEEEALLPDSALYVDIHSSGCVSDEPRAGCKTLSWQGTLQKVRALFSDTSVSLLLACSFLKQTAFFSESYFVQYASETYQLPYNKAAWFIGFQATGAIVALGLILPAAASSLQQILPSQWEVDLFITRISLTVLICAYASVCMSPTGVVYAIGTYYFHAHLGQ